MTGIPDLDPALAIARGPAVNELLSLMGRVNMADLTTPEVVALVAVFSAADARVNAGVAPVLRLHRDGEARRP